MDTAWVQSSTASVWTQQAGYEYQLVIRPDAATAEQVLAEKQLFAAQYKQTAIAKTPPHITVASFTAREEMEETIIRWVHRITSAQQSFVVTLNNYSGIPPHTIYLRIQDPLPFLQMALQLKAVNEYVKSCDCPPMQLMSRPHLSIACRLPEAVYEKAMPVYSHQLFHAAFAVQELVLLRRRHRFDERREINVFKLLP